ncbi:MAG: hypothetical protein PHQ09_06660 [Actinomycetota bacterium]|nr:hypothetical protein [Actinomycetota bacterium]
MLEKIKNQQKDSASGNVIPVNYYNGDVYTCLNEKKVYLNKLIDDFEKLAYKLKYELSAGINDKKIKHYSKKMEDLNEGIIGQRKIITRLEHEIRKIKL